MKTQKKDSLQQTSKTISAPSVLEVSGLEPTTQKVCPGNPYTRTPRNFELFAGSAEILVLVWGAYVKDLWMTSIIPAHAQNHNPKPKNVPALRASKPPEARGTPARPVLLGDCYAIYNGPNLHAPFRLHPGALDAVPRRKIRKLRRGATSGFRIRM